MLEHYVKIKKSSKGNYTITFAKTKKIIFIH